MNPNTKETIRTRLPIESVVGSYVKLEKVGKNFRACCPFHNEKTPSFYVTPDRGIYYCYGCHKGGDIFKFVEEIEGVSFIDALKSLAEKAGVSLDMKPDEKPSRIGILRDIMETTTKHYEIGLRTNKPAVDYLLGRGMTKETMVIWRVGYALQGWSGLYNYLKKKAYEDQDILATGLCITGQQKGLYDRFRERIMFPITDAQGRVIAFTGRIIPGTEEASRPVGKYINSPETDLYHKSAVLFGFDKAKSSIHSENFVIVVEGQMDCIMSHQAGVTNVVALSGTACTDLHMKQIARFTTNVAICLDADHAGLVAAQKTAMVAYAHNMKVLVIDISNGKDPADMIAENSEQWKETVKHRKDFITFRLEKMKQQGNLADKVAIAEKELFPILMYIQSQITLDDRLVEIAHAFGSSTVEPVRKEFEKFMHKKALEIPEHTHSKEALADKDQKKMLEERLVGILLLLKNLEIDNVMKNRFAEIIEPFENYISRMDEYTKKELMFQTEQLLGELPVMLPVYKRAFHDDLTRYELLGLEDERKKLNQSLVGTPDDVGLLTQLHALQVRRDQLIRTLY